jgi:hypothetical protein
VRRVLLIVDLIAGCWSGRNNACSNKVRLRVVFGMDHNDCFAVVRRTNRKPAIFVIAVIIAINGGLFGGLNYAVYVSELLLSPLSHDILPAI